MSRYKRGSLSTWISEDAITKLAASKDPHLAERRPDNNIWSMKILAGNSTGRREIWNPIQDLFM